MTEGRSPAGLACRLLAVLTLCWAAAAWAQPTPPVLDRVLDVQTVEFCADTASAFDTQTCQWQTVTLPHRWQPRGEGPAWALYRFTVPNPGLPAVGVLTERLSLHGLLRVDGRVVAPGVASGHALAHLRYWPQLYSIATDSAPPGQALRVEIAVRGHPLAKNGLGRLSVAPPALAIAQHEREWRVEVLALLALAAATGMAGLLGLAAGDFRTLAGRLLRVAAWIALLAAARMATNYVIEPPLPLRAWTAVNVLLLAAIAACSCLAIGVYLWPQRRGLPWATAAALIGMAAGLALVPARWFFPWAEAWFVALGVAGVLLFGALLLRMARTPDALGWAILLPVLGIVVLGLHDLRLHLGGQSMSDDYLQKWSVPGLLILMIALLGRRVASQRSVEAALTRETARREELLRDLHDGIGSRLVALSFHARRGGEASRLGEEIDALLRELQVIQGAVRAGPTTLPTLMADLRHLYARIGGGSLPLQWHALDACPAVPLSAQQAVATVRIFEEAVANALKHAQPHTIRIEAAPAAPPFAAALTVSDDGPGRFEPDSGRGLHNMRVRAQRAGLVLRLEPADPGAGAKIVRLLFPTPQPRHRFLRRIAGIRDAQLVDPRPTQPNPP